MSSNVTSTLTGLVCSEDGVDSQNNYWAYLNDHTYDWSHVGAEILTVILLILCIIDASKWINKSSDSDSDDTGSAGDSDSKDEQKNDCCSKYNWLNIWVLISGVIFGIVLEYVQVTIKKCQYQYGYFAINVQFDTTEGSELNGVPIVIGFGWGNIIFAARNMSNGTNLPEWVRPFLDTILALMMDHIMDFVAIRSYMWSWANSYSYEYFGVPFENFWGWYCIVLLFSSFLRILTWLAQTDGLKKYQWVPWTIPLITIILAASVFTLIDYVMVSLLIPVGIGYSTQLFLELMGVTLIIMHKPQFYVRKVQFSAMYVPMGLMLYFGILGFILSDEGWFTEPIALIVTVYILVVYIWILTPLFKEWWVYVTKCCNKDIQNNTKEAELIEAELTVQYGGDTADNGNV